MQAHIKNLKTDGVDAHLDKRAFEDAKCTKDICVQPNKCVRVPLSQGLLQISGIVASMGPIRANRQTIMNDFMENGRLMSYDSNRKGKLSLINAPGKRGVLCSCISVHPCQARCCPS